MGAGSPLLFPRRKDELMKLCPYCGQEASHKIGDELMCEYCASAMIVATKREIEWHVQTGAMTKEEGKKALEKKLGKGWENDQTYPAKKS